MQSVTQSAPAPTTQPIYASVVVDVRARAVDRAFDYVVPEGFAAQVQVGCCVLVMFGGRPAVGYVVGLSHQLPEGLDPARVLPVERVLSAPIFMERDVAAARWIANRYAASLSDAIRLFCPPGFSAHMVRDEAGQWALRQAEVSQVDDTWVSLTQQGRDFAPAPNASRQRSVIEALREGPMRQAELGLSISGVASTVRALATRGVVQVEKRRRVRGQKTSSISSAAAPKRSVEELTDGQRQALHQIGQACDAGRGDVVVLDGVTGSGKTEVYLAAIERVLAQGKDAVVLVPEISLTPQTVGRFRSRFGDQVAVLHSRLAVGERYDQWDLVRSGGARVVVGARSALFAPLANPGIYVVDEEHESSYKQSGPPRYHARDVAAYLARMNGAALVLGSATPSVETLARSEADLLRDPSPLSEQPANAPAPAPLATSAPTWTLVKMPERPGARPLPPVEIVDMAQEFSSGWRSMFSRTLTQAIQDVVQRGQKAVLMLNQRGFARWLLCRDCGYVPRCEHCSTSLTFHQHGNKLVCHTCGTEYPVPPVCPECGSHYLKMSGMGTQQVEDRLRSQLDEIVSGGVPVIRMDADSTRGKDGHERCLEQFDAAPSAILLGTQMIAKGLDFPQVTLAGVINADTVLKVCDFRAAERTYDLLEQVSGRAGRGDTPGRVVIQTYQPQHPAILAAAHHDRSIFLAQEMPLRREALYPPFVRLANIVIKGPDEEIVSTACSKVADAVRAQASETPGAAKTQVLGPAPCVISRLQDNYRWHVLVKADPVLELGELCRQALRRAKTGSKVSVTVDVDPYDMM